MAPAPTRRRLSRRQRRTLVLDAALAVFAADGYERAAMDGIAVRAGISKPVLYDHFDSKRELYIAVLGRQVSALRGRVLPAAEPPGRTLEERMRLSALAALSFARDHPEGWLLLFQEPIGDEEIARAFSEMRAAATEAVSEVIATNGFKPPRGVDAEVAARAVARMVMAAIESLGDQALECPSVDLEALLSIYMDLVWVGIRQLVPRPPSGS
jgi:AcrR family transcriptional regulator